MDTQPESSRKRPIIVTIAVLVIIGGLIGAQIALSGKKPETAVLEPTKTASPARSSASPAAVYKDGTYTAAGVYSSPGGAESIDVTLTVAGGVVTDSSAVPHPATANSREYQDDFVQNYKAMVVGKSIADLELSHVSGSSLTPQGFNDAVEKIKSQATS